MARPAVVATSIPATASGLPLGNRLLATWHVNGVGPAVSPFTNNAGDWSYEGELAFPYSDDFSGWGDSISLDGDVAATSYSGLGEVQLFRWLGSHWAYYAIVPAADFEKETFHSGRVAISDGHLLNGVRVLDDYTGRADAYEYSTCGDGAIHAAEECEDGNVAHGDGCSRSCLVERSLSKGDVKCVKGMHTKGVNAAKKESKSFAKCMKRKAKDDEWPACGGPPLYGSDLKVEKLEQKTCLEAPPPFGSIECSSGDPRFGGHGRGVVR